MVSRAPVAKRPTTQPGQKAYDKDPHPANHEGGEREPNEGHIDWQPLVASPQSLSERATRNWLHIEGSNLGTAWEICRDRQSAMCDPTPLAPTQR